MKKNVLPDGYNSHMGFILKNWDIINRSNLDSAYFSGLPTWENKDLPVSAVEIDRDWMKARAFDELSAAFPKTQDGFLCLFDQVKHGQRAWSFAPTPKEYKALIDGLYQILRKL